MRHPFDGDTYCIRRGNGCPRERRVHPNDSALDGPDSACLAVSAALCLSRKSHGPRGIDAMANPKGTWDQDPKDVALGIAAYLAVGLPRPSWINRHIDIRLTFAQHFRRRFLTRALVLVISPSLRVFSERSDEARTRLRDELGREPTIDEVVAWMGR